MILRRNCERFGRPLALAHRPIRRRRRGDASRSAFEACGAANGALRRRGLLRRPGRRCRRVAASTQSIFITRSAARRAARPCPEGHFQQHSRRRRARRETARQSCAGPARGGAARARRRHLPKRPRRRLPRRCQPGRGALRLYHQYASAALPLEPPSGRRRRPSRPCEAGGHVMRAPRRRRGVARLAR